MDATRVAARLRIAPLVEWLVAAAFLCATVAVALARSCASCGARRGSPPRRRRRARCVASMPAGGAAARGVGAGAAVPRRQGDPGRRDSGRRGRQRSAAPRRAAGRKSIAARSANA